MKLLFIHNFYRQRGGEDAVVEAEISLLQAAGHHVELFSVDSQAVAAAGAFERAAAFVQVPWSFAQARRLSRYCAQHAFDAAHVHNLSPFLSASVLGALPPDLPRVQTIHNFRAFCANGLFLRDAKPCEDCPRGSGLEGIVHRCHQGSLASSTLITLARGTARLAGTRALVDRFLCPSRFVMEKHIEHGFAPESLSVLPHSVEDPGMQKASPEAGLFLGRLSEEKGVRVLARALSQSPQARVLVAGDGPLAAELDGRAERLGWLQAKEIPAAFKRAGFLVCPSICYETQSLVALDAMARGLPVLASDRGALAQVVQHGKSGYLFRAGDAGALAQGLEKMRRLGPTGRRRLGAEGRRLYLKQHAPAAHLKGLLAAYKAAIKGRRP